MQKVLYRKSKNAYVATILENGNQKQLRLVNAPNDKHARKLAEDQLLKELAARNYSNEKESAVDPIPSSATAGHVIWAFLKYSVEEHIAKSSNWHRHLLPPFVDLFGNVRVAQLRNKHIR